MRRLFLCAGFMLAWPGLALAAPGITYDCDTAVSHYSELRLPTPVGPFTVTGQLQVNQVPAFDKFAPITRLVIFSGNNAPGGDVPEAAGFSLNALPASTIDPKIKDKQLLVQFAQWNAIHGGKAEEFKPFGFARIGGKSPFTLKYDGEKIAITLGEETTILPLKVADPMVRIICSTGEFLYTDLRIEKAP